MAHLYLGLVTLAFTSALADPVQYFYCGRKTFSETSVSVSRNAKFITDMTAESMQNLTVLLDPGSFIVDVTGCITPIGELSSAVGLEIKYKLLPTIYSGAIQNLLDLVMLTMEHCEIREIEPGAFLELPLIKAIFLKFNRIERIREGVFNHLNVVELYLSNNSISYIEHTAFDNMPNLALLELDGNRLKLWSTDWLTNSPNVEILSLDSNHLVRLPANAFKKLRNHYSTSIRLSNNEIVYVHPTAFQGLNLLYALWLDNNSLHELDDEVFLHFERIYVLSLAGNKIACLSDELLYNLQSQEVILHVEDNERMDCQCLRKIEKWARIRNHFFSERFAKEECDRKREQKLLLCP